MVNTRSRPVISKIFVMLRSLHTSESWPSFVRRRLTPPTRTPSVVEVRAERPLRLRVGERVTLGARLAALRRGEEQLLAVRGVAARHPADGAAPRCRERDEQERDRCCEGASQSYELG